jgi:hypothetical protein
MDSSFSDPSAQQAARPVCSSKRAFDFLCTDRITATLDVIVERNAPVEGKKLTKNRRKQVFILEL